MMIADGRQFLSLIANEDSVHPDPQSISHLWTNGAEYVVSMRRMFELLWRNSIHYETRLRQLATGASIREGLRGLKED